MVLEGRLRRILFFAVMLIVAALCLWLRSGKDGRLLPSDFSMQYWYHYFITGVPIHHKTARQSRRAIESGNGTTTDYWQLARWEYTYGSQSKAISLLEQGMAIPSTPPNSTCYSYLAKILIEQGRSDLAIAKCPFWMGKNYSYFCWIARLERKEGHVKEAHSHYLTALDLAKKEGEEKRREINKRISTLKAEKDSFLKLGVTETEMAFALRKQEADLRKIDARYVGIVDDITSLMRQANGNYVDE